MIDLKARRAAEAAGQWWADRLDEQYADKRDAFAQAVADKVYDALMGVAYWAWNEGRKERPEGGPVHVVHTECDYDPQGLLLDAVREIINPDCRGIFFSAIGILPNKHSLAVSRERLAPKEGYGAFTPHIVLQEEE